MIGIIDTHAHLDEIENLRQTLEAARNANVIAIVAVGSDRESNQRVLDIAQRYPGFVFPALGLHPMNLYKTELEAELEFIDSHSAQAIGVGEIGLDYHKRVIASASKDIQKTAFNELLKIASKYDKVALIHSRYAWKDSFSLVEVAGVQKAVFHWYTGPSTVLGDILRHGFYLSITPAIEYHSEHRRAARETPLDRLLLETDSPVMYGRGREGEFQSQPADVERSLAGIARLKELPVSEIAEKTTANAIALFGLLLH